MKSLGDFDQCLVVYHKCDAEENAQAIDLIYVVNNIEGCC